MTEEDARIEATEQIRLLADVACPPDIEDQLIWILARCRRATIYAVSTAYSRGDVVQLATRKGHRYRCVVAGTSAATAPTFPVCDGSQLTDGTVQWVEDGPDYANPYDIRAGIHEAWMLKAAKASHLVNINPGSGISISAGDMQRQFRERAKDYAPVGFA